MSSAIVLVPRTHWVNGWFLRLFSVPVLRIDDVDHAARWGEAVEIAVEPGRHRVGVGARYRGTSSVLGLQEARIEVAEGRRIRAEARNGPMNHQPFEVVERGAEPLEEA